MTTENATAVSPEGLSRSHLEAVVLLTGTLASLRDLPAIYEAAMNALFSLLPIDRASVLLFDEDDLMRFVAWRGLSETYRAAVDGHSPWTTPAASPSPIIVPDVRNDHDLAPYREVIESEGINALAFIPLVSGGHTIGKFMLYCDEPHAFTDEEIRVAEAIAAHVAQALERSRREEHLRRSHSELEAILNGVRAGITAQTADGRIVLANPAAAAMSGFDTVEELLATPVVDVVRRFEILTEESEPVDLSSMPGARALRGEYPESMIVRIRPKKSPVPERFNLVSASPIFNLDGSVRYAINVFNDVTDTHQRTLERQQLLSEIRKERNLLETVVRQMPSGVVIAEAPGGRIMIGNQEIEKIWRREVIFSESVDDYVEWEGFHPDGRRVASHEWPMARTIEAGETVMGEEFDIARGDGTRGTVLISAAPIRDDDGRIAAGVVTVTDVTHLKEVEGRQRFLAKASELLATSLDTESILRTIARLAVPVVAEWCAIDMAEDGDKAPRRLAVAHRDPAQVRWAQELGERYPPQPDSLPARVIRSGRPEMINVTDDLLERLAQDGEHLRLLRQVGLSSAMIVPLTAHGRTHGAITFVASRSGRAFEMKDLDLAQDLARRAALAIDNARLYQDEQLARQRAESAAVRIARLQEVTAALSVATTPERVAEVILREGMQAFDSVAGSVYLRGSSSLALVDATGYPDEYLESFSEIPLDDSLPLSEAVSRGEPVFLLDEAELYGDHPALQEASGRKRRSFAAIPLMLGDHALGMIGLSYQGIFEPSAEDRQFAVALARQCAQAMDRARLHEAEREAREAAESANRAKDDFLATLSHEMRTPLTATLGWARMLSTSGVDAETQETAIAAIYRSSQAQARIVDDLLDVSRIITGKMRLELGPTDLESTVESAVEAVRGAAEAKQIEIVVEIEPHVTVNGDADRLRQVVWNLLSNAIKFTEESGRVEVRLSRRPEGAMIEVTDTGIGIDGSFLPHIFDRFRQADSSTARLYGGLGLGLSIVKHLVEMHGGTVTAESDGAGMGATFRILIPLFRAGSPTEPGGVQRRRVDLSGISIAVVEDDQDTRLFIIASLERCGAMVRGSHSAAAALRLLDTFHPDVIVSDLAMPAEDGLYLIRTLRGAGVAVPAIALTAYGREEDRQAALDAGFDLYLRKPIEQETLAAAVARLTKRSS
jgi:PAS domain S-box-containing protein